MNSAVNNATVSLEHLVEQAIERLKADEPLNLSKLAGSRADLLRQLETMLPTLQALVVLEGTGGEQRSPWAGQKLGDFHLVREIGRGGMGIVFEARQISLARRVAVKVLPHATLLPERARHRFEREARAASLLRHPHIVPIFGFGCEDGLHYYAMQFIDGENLAEVIQRRQSGLSGTVADALATKYEHSGPLAPREESVSGMDRPAARVAGVLYSKPSPKRASNPQSWVLSTKPSHPSDWFRQVAEIGRQVALGLHHAHEAGVVHRDIKPANLLLDREGNAWIADFGLARCDEAEGLTMTGDLPGTLRYMSPEQLREDGARVDRHTDIYSLAATLWELAAMRPLHDGGSRKELTKQIEAAQPPALRRFCRAAPRDLEAVLSKALARNPAERYATAQEMEADLAEFLRGKRVKARQRGVSRRAVLIGAAGAVVLSGVGIGMLPGKIRAGGLPANLAFQWEIHAVSEVKDMNGDLWLQLSREGVLRNHDSVIIKSGNPTFDEDVRALDVGPPSGDFPVKLATNPATHGYIWKVIAPDKDYQTPLMDGDWIVLRSENNNFAGDAFGRNLEVRWKASEQPPVLVVSRVRLKKDWKATEKWRLRRVAGRGEVQSRELVCLESLGDDLGEARLLHGDGGLAGATLSMRSPEGVLPRRPKPARIIVLEATDDAMIHGKYVTENLDRELACRGGGPVLTGVKFDVSSLTGAKIQRAVVRAKWRVSGTVTLVDVRGYRGAKDWTEETVTWDNMNGGKSPLAMSGPILDVAFSQIARAEDRDKFAEWDVTPEVQGWLDGSLVNRGLLFVAPLSGSKAISFYSREALDGTHGPKLVVEVRD